MAPKVPTINFYGTRNGSLPQSWNLFKIGHVIQYTPYKDTDQRFESCTNYLKHWWLYHPSVLTIFWTTDQIFAYVGYQNYVYSFEFSPLSYRFARFCLSGLVSLMTILHLYECVPGFIKHGELNQYFFKYIFRWSLFTYKSYFRAFWQHA
jgi:hypothetical protein